MPAKRVGKCAAKIIVRYSKELIPKGDTQALIALASGPLAEVGMTVIGVSMPHDRSLPREEEPDEQS